jgi:site-specific DNA recombinase
LDERDKTASRLASIDRYLDRATSLLIKGILDEEKGAAQVTDLKKERADLLALQARLGEKPAAVVLLPAAVASYLASIENLDDAIRSGDGAAKPENLSPIRDLIEKITIAPLDDGEMGIELEGDLSKLMTGTHGRVGSSGGAMVAEEGLEPPTRGL